MDLDAFRASLKRWLVVATLVNLVAAALVARYGDWYVAPANLLAAAATAATLIYVRRR